MSRLVDIDDERFWDILFDEAYVEGNQAGRIQNELNKIAVESAQNNLISKNDVFRMIEKQSDIARGDGATLMSLALLKGDIESLPAVCNDKWALVKDEPPTKDGKYWVTYENGYVAQDWWNSKCKKFTKNNSFTKPIAWKLYKEPQPYKESENNIHQDIDMERD